ncbi:hypothetical protein M2139_002633 [Enterococcus sp. PF1-24]|uniref:MucBP domain-containing protein n=1 Tax=unclassified Enterococcus TaxID=2608891 RepID=UPI0024744268|nr:MULTISPECIES: MucBP domain-containing protein [unclassified Enterococcus]MDH6365626.1 hypothetical protein [Enterococcus sp. PFB1-1]MDH6402727.1 hypothetical protein [Enterococcus sp. PF1-24]
MKKFRKTLAILTSLCVTTVFSSTVVSAETIEPAQILTSYSEEPIDSWMPNKILQQIVAEQLGLPSADQITKERLANSDSIILSSSSENHYDRSIFDIDNFTGLEYASGITISCDSLESLPLPENWNKKSFSDMKIFDYPEISAKTTASFTGNISDFFPNSLDFSLFKDFPQVTMSNCFYDSQSMIELNQNTYTNFFISYEELGLSNVPKEGICEDNLPFRIPYDNENNLNYTASFSESGIQCTLNETDFDYSLIAGKTIQHKQNSESLYDSILSPYIELPLNYSSDVDDSYYSFWIPILVNFRFGMVSTVTAEYWEYDTAGNPVKKIADDIPFTGEVGTDYTTTQKNISGYTFVKVIGNAAGQFGDSNETIIYVYKKKTTSTPSEPNNPNTPGSVPDEVLLPVWRAYNFGDGDHLYTTSREEYDWIVGLGWQAEEIAFHSVTSAYEKAIPAYRLYNPNSGEHFYTLSEAEYEAVAAKGWNKEGIGYYMVPENLGYTIYRVFNPNATGPGSHLFTKSREEADWLISLGWEDEGIAFYSAR